VKDLVVPTLNRPTPLELLATAATLLCAANPLAADVTNKTYVNSSVYDYRITSMTDIDQKRTGLPGSGSMFCVPTSCFNLFAYAANHGFPVGGLPPANYMGAGQYDYVTTWLDFIGDLMQTDGSDGTTCCVTSAYASLVNGSLLKRTTKYITSEFTPGQASMTQLACNGWIVSFTYGRYEQIGTMQGNPIFDRGGGHAVTLTRSLRNGSQRIIKYRDPDNDSSLLTQSPYANKEYSPTTVTGWFPPHGLRNMTRLFSSNGNPRFIDALHAIRPIYGIQFENTDDAVGGGTIKVLDPIPFEGSEGATLSDVPVTPFLTVLDVALHPDGASGLVIAKPIIVGTSSRLRTLDLATGALAIIDAAPQNLVKMDWSGRNRIFAYDTSGVLHRLDGDGNPVGTMPTIPPPSALAVDDASDAVWIVSVAQRKLVKLSASSLAVLLTINIPTNVPMAGDADLVFDPNNGFPWMRTDASTTLYGIKPGATAGPTIFTANLGSIESISLSDDRLYVGGSNGIKVYKPTASAPGWTFDNSSPFNGLPGGGRLAMLRNTDNYDPALHSGPAWQNLTTAEIGDTAVDVADCLGDANEDGVVDATDLGLLLGAWGSTADVGDLNQDGTVNAADIAALLGAWGPCP
jgi:hypothetical protein